MAESPRLIAYNIGYPMPELRPARVRRDWMDAVPNGAAYRCLPLTIANGHGWEIILDCDLEAIWTGEIAKESLTIVGGGGAVCPVSHFGSGVVTFHVNVLFRTPAATNLWVSGPPNTIKDGIVPLSGIIEADWSPMTFTMNWRFTRPYHRVFFRKGEAFCFFFPLSRHFLNELRPEVRPICDDARAHKELAIWQASRRKFVDELQANPQRLGPLFEGHYHRGELPSSIERVSDHFTRMRPHRFDFSFADGEKTDEF